MLRRACLLAALLLAALPPVAAHALPTPAAHAQVGGNAATGYRRAFTMAGWLREPGAPPAGEALITADDNEFLSRVQAPMSQGDRARLDALLLKAKPITMQIQEAAHARKCDWELDRSQGFEMLMPHLAPMRSAARLMRAQAMAQIEDGDSGGAIATLGTLGELGMHAGQDKVLVSSLVGGAISGVMTATGADAIDAGTIDAKTAAKLLEALGPMKRPDPFRFTEAVQGEFETLTASVRGAKNDQELRDLLSMADGSTAASSEALKVNLENAKSDLRRLKPLFDEAASAFANPNPDAGMAALRKVEQEIEAGRGGPLAKVLLPSFVKIFKAKLTATQELELFLARLQAIADGKETRQEVVNAAILLARASAAARGIPDDAQEAIELMRVAPDALDAAGAKRATDMLARAQRPVLQPLCEAATMKRCDFRALHRPSPSLEVPFLGGLRGAVRVALAEGLRAARERGEGDAALPALVVGYRVAALLASDPGLARAIVGHSIWRETTAALQDAQRISPLSKLSADELERALATMNGSDPFGFRKGSEADAVRTVDEMTRFASGASPEAREARAAILRQRGATSMFARVALATIARRADDTLPAADDAVLVRVVDLYPPTAIASAQKALADADLRYAEPRKETAAIRDLAIYPPVPFDLPLDEQKTRFRREDPVRGVVFIDASTLVAQACADYLRAFDALKAGRAGAPAQ